MRLHLDKKKKLIYIFDELYLTELPDEEAMKLVYLKLNKKSELITADSSEPKTISLWQSKGYSVRGAVKGPGSIETGIKFLKSYRIIIHPRCNNTRMEFNKYKWKESKDGTVLPVPVDKDNHIIDSLRYSLESEMGGINGSGIDWAKAKRR